jgi:misacylated tRNA(Ala) deacylase
MAGTELLFMKDVEANYIRDFQARVLDRGPGYLVLERTAFYPDSGGQPSDTGMLSFLVPASMATRLTVGPPVQGPQQIPVGDLSGQGAAPAMMEVTVRVKEVKKERQIRHFYEGEVPVSVMAVKGKIDWERRHAHMRMHTAQHIISGIVFDEHHARTVGNQLHADSSRIDFAPIAFTPEMVAELEAKCNKVFSSALPVTIYEQDRAELEKRIGLERANLDLLPKSVQRLRIIQVGEIDICPCAGTHVRNTSEIGTMKIIKRESKGKDRERITYNLTV